MTHDAIPALPIPIAPRPARQLSRRRLLRAAGVAMALPMLECFAPRGAAAAAAAANPIRRMVCICTPLGLHPEFFFPEKAGKDYVASPYLEPLADLRNDFSIISGLQ